MNSFIIVKKFHLHHYFGEVVRTLDLRLSVVGSIPSDDTVYCVDGLTCHF